MARAFSCVVLFVVLLRLVDPVQRCDHLVGEEDAGCFAFLWSVLACVLVLFVMVCLLFLLVLLVCCNL